MTPAPDAFYITGGTLRSDAPCYVERRADRELFEGLSRGEFCYVLTARQMGKSSLMVRTAKRLRDDGACVAVLDLTAVGQNLTAEQWYDGLLGRLGEQLGLEDQMEAFWAAHARLGPLERWMRALVEVALPACRGPLVVFVDEIDAVRSLPFSTDEFFAAVRECYNRRTADPALRRLTFCLLGVASPSDLIRDTRTTPFNIGLRVELDDFAETEAAVLARGLNRDDDVASEILRRVLYWTQGHPYLTQRLCRAAAEDAAVEGLYEVDKLCRQLFLSSRARERDDNLLFVRERILRSEVDRAALLDLYARVWAGRRVEDEEANPLVGVLRLSGVARAVGGRLRVRNPIYGKVFDAEWVRTNMPDAEVRRQKRAFRRGLLRAGVAVAVVMAAVGGLGGYAWYKTSEAQFANSKSQITDEANKKLAEANGKLEQANHDAERAESDAMHARDEARRLAVRYRVATGMQMAGKGDLSGALPWFADAMDIEKDKPERESAHRLRLEAALGQCPGLVRVWAHDGLVYEAGFDADGGRAVSAGADKTARVWDVNTGACVAVLRHDKPVIHAALNPDGKRVLTVCKDDSTARLWDVGGDKPRFQWAHDGRVTWATFSADGALAATAAEDGTARVWNVETGKPVTPALRHVRPRAGMGTVEPEAAHPGPEAAQPLRCVAFDPQCKRVVLAGDDGTAEVWPVSPDAKEPLAPPIKVGRPILHAAFSPDGRFIATAAGALPSGKPSAPTPPPASPDAPPPAPSSSLDFDFLNRAGVGQVWYADSGNPDSAELNHDGKVVRVAFSPDGRCVVTASEDRTATLWRRGEPSAVAPPDPAMPNPEPQDDWGSGTPLKHTGPVADAAFSPDGRYVVTASGDGTARVWNVRSGEAWSPPLNHAGRVTAVAFNPAGRRVLTAGEDGLVRLWDLRPCDEDRRAFDPVRAPQQAAVSAAGRRGAVVDEDGLVWLGDLADPAAAPRPLAPAGGATAAWLSPDGRRLATMNARNALQVWDAETGLALCGPVPARPALKGVFSADGRRLLLIGPEHGAVLWDADAVRPIAELEANVAVYDAAFSADGRLLAISRGDKVDLFEPGPVAGPPRTLEDPNAGPDAQPRVQALAFSPDGRVLAVGGRDGARLWDTADPGRPPRLLPHRDQVTSVAFSPDGTRVVTGSVDNTARVWNAATGDEVCDALPHDDEVSCVAFSADGARIATGSRNGAARVWEADTGLALTHPLKHASNVYTLAFQAPDQLVTATDRHRLHVWRLTPLGGPRDGLMAEAQLLSGQQLFLTRDRSRPLAGGDVRRLWDGLPVPAALAPDPAWDAQQAAAAEDDEDWDVALWRLARLCAARPTARLEARMARDLMKAHRMGEAEKALAEAGRLAAAGADPRDAAPALRWDEAELPRERGDDVVNQTDWKGDAWADKRDEALHAYQECRDLAAGLPPDHLLTVRLTGALVGSYRDLAQKLSDAGRADAAEACCQECWDMLRPFPPDRPNVGQLRQDLAGVFVQLAQARMPPAPTKDSPRVATYGDAVAKARDLYLRGLEVNESITGEDAARPDVVRQQFTLVRGAADAYRAQSDDCRAQADDLRSHGDPDKARTLGDQAQEFGDRAVPLYERALKVADRVVMSPLDLQDPRADAADVLDALLRLHHTLGHEDKARDQGRQAVERVEAWLRKDPADAKARSWAGYINWVMGQLLDVQKDSKAALPYLHRARALREALAADNPTADNRADVADVCRTLARVCVRVNNPQGARQYGLECAQQLEEAVKLDGTDKYRPALAEACENLARGADDEAPPAPGAGPADARGWWRKALEQRDALLTANETDETRGAAAEDAGRLADHDLAAGDFRAALAGAGRALELVNKQSSPEAADLALANVRLAGVALRAGFFDRAGTAFVGYESARVRFEHGDPAGLGWQIDLANAYAGRARLALGAGDAAEAVRLARRAVAGRQELCDGRAARETAPDAATLEDHRTVALRQLGAARLAAGDPAAADVLIDAAGLSGDVFADAYARLDVERRVAGELAEDYRLLGAARLEAGDLAGARAAFIAALGIDRSLADEEPREPRWGYAVARDCRGLADAARQADDCKEAARLLRRGLVAAAAADGQPAGDNALLLAALRRDLVFCDNAAAALGDLGPVRARPYPEAADLLTLRAETQVRRNAATDAAASAEALRGLAPDDAANLLAVARCYARMAEAVARGRPMLELSDDERDRQGDYVRQGLDALGEAVKHGFKDEAVLHTDPDLDALRGEKDYLDLLDGLAPPPAPAPVPPPK